MGRGYFSNPLNSSSHIPYTVLKAHFLGIFAVLCYLNASAGFDLGLEQRFRDDRGIRKTPRNQGGR